MRTKKIRLGIAVAALSAIVGAPVVAATQAAAWAGSDVGAVTGSSSVTDASAQFEQAASLAGFDWQ